MSDAEELDQVNALDDPGENFTDNVIGYNTDSGYVWLIFKKNFYQNGFVPKKSRFLPFLVPIRFDKK